VPRQFSHEALAKRITSLSDLPLGSKSAPPTTIGNVVKLFLKVCSNAKILKYLNLQKERSPPYMVL
jgi:hypothetical protein